MREGCGPERGEYWSCTILITLTRKSVRSKRGWDRFRCNCCEWGLVVHRCQDKRVEEEEVDGGLWKEKDLASSLQYTGSTIYSTGNVVSSGRSLNVHRIKKYPWPCHVAIFHIILQSNFSLTSLYPYSSQRSSWKTQKNIKKENNQNQRIGSPKRSSFPIPRLAPITSAISSVHLSQCKSRFSRQRQLKRSPFRQIRCP